VCTLNGGDMFGAMKATIAAERALRNAAAAEAGDVVTTLVPTCRDVVEFATIGGARANGLDARTGSLTPGKEADIIVLRTDSAAMLPVNNPYGSIVYSAHPGVVDTVLVGGVAVKRDGQLLADLERVRRLAYESRDYLFERGAADPAIPGARAGGEWIPEPMVARAET
jgi:cytosine/adenosine deaminase-related metal-dependent hydrolase